MHCVLEVLCVLLVSTYYGLAEIVKIQRVILTDTRNTYDLKAELEMVPYGKPYNALIWQMEGPVGRLLELYCPVKDKPKHQHCPEGTLNVKIWSGQNWNGYTILCKYLQGYRKRFVLMKSILRIRLVSSSSDRSQFDCTLRLLSTDPKTWTNTTRPTCPCGERGKLGKPIQMKDGQLRAENFPFVAYIKLRNKRKAICGGTVITTQHVLTAASCVYKHKGNLQVILRGREDVEITEYNIQNDFRSKDSPPSHNIAILGLAKPSGEPVCFALNSYNLYRLRFTAFVWTNPTDENGVSDAPRLEEVEVRVVGNDRLGEHINTRWMQGRNTTQTDMGAPMLYLDPELDRYVLVGYLAKRGAHGSYDTQADLTGCHWINHEVQGQWCTKIEITSE